MRFRVIGTAEYDKTFSKLSKSEQEQINKIIEQLKEKGATVGKPLCGLSFLREKKFEGKRLYYSVYNEVLVILVLGISDKKAQQATINSILPNLVEYRKFVYDFLSKK